MTTTTTALEQMASTFLTFSAIWAVVYMASDRLFTNVTRLNLFRPPTNHRAASRGMGICHAIFTVSGALWTLYHSQSHSYNGPNTAVETYVVTASLAYFCVDLLHFFAFEFDGAMFAHHLVCIGYQSYTLWHGTGASAVLAAIVMGEITNPLQSGWFLAKEAGNMKLYARLSPYFTVVFVVLRLFVAPVWVYGMVKFEFTQAIAPSISVDSFVRICMPIGLTVGGFWWAYALAQGYRKFLRKSKAQAKQPATVNGTTHNGVNGVNGINGVNGVNGVTAPAVASRTRKAE